MPNAALLRVSAPCTVVAINDVAERWLGPVVGRPCHEVVGARDPAGGAHCSRWCADRLLRVGGTTGLGHTSVRGRPACLTCSALDGEIVVALQPPADESAANPLSARERQVLGLVAAGFTNRRVSRRLEISMSTVRTHMERILDKLDARSRASAVQRAIATGQLPNL